MHREETRVRVNMRMPPELVRWAKKQAKKLDMSFTQLVVRSLELAQQNMKDGHGK